ncbi:excinuclease ABC subunit UvrA, partial [Candidatus Curtissbacteria bacterium]|nr:excinuclease ABC subunit UvrA [Candidatus Curtissbacteria bacterium]
RTFSFNSPHGACPTCTGIGTKLEVEPELVFNPNLTIAQGGILPWSRLSTHETWFSRLLEEASKQIHFSINTPIKDLTDADRKFLLYGSEKVFKVQGENRFGKSAEWQTTFEGVIPNLERRYRETESGYIRGEIEKFMRILTCPTCNGTRLKPEALSVTVDGLNIEQVSKKSIRNSLEWVKSIKTSFAGNARDNQVSEPILKEITARLQFLIDVGLDYLSLSRTATTLAGGEAQRIRLASQIGSGLSGVLYVLDEPSIGLHQRDNVRLIGTLQKLRDLGNSVLVVEHDRDMMLESDYIFDFGPGAGEHGGAIVSRGTPQEIIKDSKSLTGKYLSDKKKITTKSGSFINPHEGKELTIIGATEHNLKGIDVTIPLGKFVCFTGVSGSGKSTLVHDILYKSLAQQFYHAKERPGSHTTIMGTESLDKVIMIDQSPIGRTPRSNPATYTGIFTPIRELFASTTEAKIRGYKSGRFSFNVKGGRCEACEGEGQVKIEMQFLPDVYVDCEVCTGKRYNDEALEVHFKDKNIFEVLDMTVEEALEFFSNIPSIKNKLATVVDVGLGYIKLGQPAPTLSGGEAQRVKLASELSKRSTGKTLYILDEPTTGLHFADIEKLLNILMRLVEQGNTIVVIEHNLDVIKNADWIIDLGPEGGDGGGTVVAQGTPSEVSKKSKSHTAKFLSKLI